MREILPTVYILASRPGGTLYVGVTSDLAQRVWQHKQNLVAGFTSRYNVHTLVHFETYERMIEAIAREKKLKKWHRAWKIALIESHNPGWLDLWPDMVADLPCGPNESGHKPASK